MIAASFPASSFGSYRSGAGSEDSLSSAASTSSRPQPLSASAFVVQSTQPLAGVASTADSFRIVLAWSGLSDGTSPKSSAAAAATCGDANDVPSAGRKSVVPQFE